MNSSRYKKFQLKQLCSLLGCKPYEIEYILKHIDKYYHEWLEPKINHKTGELKKYKDGTVKQRAIRPSLNRLKSIQKAIKSKILEPIPLPANIHGGVKKKSNITNAKPHQGKKFKFTTDLQEFYPSVKSKHVYDMFLKLGFSDHWSNWLTKLTTWKYELPQGTPTSTHIANLVFLKIDADLIELANCNSLTYTRYVDDLAFSSQQDFRLHLNYILQTIKNNGFNISYRKTFYKGKQTITGVDVFNNFIDGSKTVKEKAKSELVNLGKPGPVANYLKSIQRTNKNMKKAAANSALPASPDRGSIP